MEQTEVDKTTKWCLKKLEELGGKGPIAMLGELNAKIRDPVLVYLLIVKALQAIDETDALSLEKKEDLLLNFHKKLSQPDFKIIFDIPKDWITPAEHLLEEIRWINEAFSKLPSEYKDPLKEIVSVCGKMEQKWGNKHDIETVADLDDFCYASEGLYSILLNRLLVSSKTEDKELLQQEQGAKARGLFIAKAGLVQQLTTYFWANETMMWPHDIWGRYVNTARELLDKDNRKKALGASSEMVYQSLVHLPDTISFLAQIKDKQNFFAMAVPVTIRLADLTNAFENPSIFDGPQTIESSQYHRLVQSLRDEQFNGFASSALASLHKIEKKINENHRYRHEMKTLIAKAKEELSKVPAKKLSKL